MSDAKQLSLRFPFDLDGRQRARLAEIIVAIHRELSDGSHNQVQRAAAAGGLFREAKALVGHFHWSDCLEASNLPITTSTAERYMRLHREWPYLESVLGNTVVTTVHDALKALVNRHSVETHRQNIR